MKMKSVGRRRKEKSALLVAVPSLPCIKVQVSPRCPRGLSHRYHAAVK